jgi:hypothetical protein
LRYDQWKFVHTSLDCAEEPFIGVYGSDGSAFGSRIGSAGQAEGAAVARWNVLMAMRWLAIGVRPQAAATWMARECHKVFVASSFQTIRHAFLTGQHWHGHKEDRD